jgi:isocitrate dehydrogenase kinase/phosphatase
LLEGLNPEKLGFFIEKNYYDFIKKLISKRNIEKAYWKNIQENIPKTRIPYYNSEIQKLVEWLKTQNFDNSKESNYGLQVTKYYLFILYALLPQPIRARIHSIGRTVLWSHRKNLIHLLSTS